MRTLDVLIDLVGSFEPAPGFEFVGTPTENHELRELLRQAVRELKDDVER